jgi:hypothetical protein
VPTLIDPQGRTRGKLLVTGEGTGDDECDVYDSQRGRTYNGLEHDGEARGLNKDGPDGPRGDLYRPARALATLQTSYEWCRLVYETAARAKEGLLLAMWVRANANPIRPTRRAPQPRRAPSPSS